MARTKSKKRLVGTWSTQQRREAMEQSREAARGPVDLPFLLLTLLLTAMGMVMVLSASFPSAYYENNGNGAYYFVRQGIFAVLGLAAMFGLSKMNYQRLRGVGRLLLWGSILLLVLVIGVVFGLVQGFCVGYLEIQPFIVTMAGMFFARGMTAVISTNQLSITAEINQTFYDLANFRIYLPFGGRMSWKCNKFKTKVN